MSANDYRKCAKCRRTRAEDMTVTFHRFPKPGKTNLNKARAWVKYCWPDQDWTSVDALMSLYRTNKVLCGRHFDSSQFYDEKRTKLSTLALPDSIELDMDQENLLNQDQSSKFVLTQASEEVPSTSEIIKQVQEHSVVVGHLTSRESLLQIQNMQVEPSTRRLTLQSKEVPSTSGINKQVATITTPSMESVHGTKKRSTILSAINVKKLSEMSPRELQLYNTNKKYLKEIVRLRKEYKHKKSNSLIKTLSYDQNVQKLCNLNMSSSFALLLQSQLRNFPRKPKGRRYTMEQKIMALVMYKKSPACYRLLRRMFALPCQSNLNKLLNRVPLKCGINSHIYSSLKQMAQSQPNEDNLCILSFDEMSIRKHLYYNIKLDEIQGFHGHGNHGRSGELATKALVFMLSGLRKKWKQPIAFYLSHTLSADRLTVIIKEVLKECFDANMNVVATVCDLSTVNIKSLRTLGATTRGPFFSFNAHEIVTILDPPHLLKCTRNLFKKHDVECFTDLSDQCDGDRVKGIARWNHIETFYKLDKQNPNFVFAPALTDHHINPNLKDQMRVKLAAQVFSHSVTSGILSKIASNLLPAEAYATATFINKFDQLFDAVNADTPNPRGGKKYSCNLTARSPHITLFREMRRYISSMKYLESRTNPPSQDGWINTMNAIEKLWTNLQKLNIKSLSTRRLNQDPLENFFGCIRYNCGSNSNPTIHQFIAGFKTAVISNLRHSGEKKNCEDDDAILYDNLSSFLSNGDPVMRERVVDTNNFTNDFLSSIENVTFDAVEAVELVDTCVGSFIKI